MVVTHEVEFNLNLSEIFKGENVTFIWVIKLGHLKKQLA